MISLADVRQAARAISGHVTATPALCSEFFSGACGAQVFLKLENLQRTGSFKVRGTFKLARSREQIGPKGVLAASAGNHAQGVALAASALGFKATIVMPQTASVAKQLATRAYGGDVILHGSNVAEALQHARELAAEGFFFVHPFDDDDVMAGQGTVGLEIVADLEAPDEIWVPVGGGGLIAGVAVAVKETHPTAKIIGVQARACPCALEALRAGRPVPVDPCHTIADGIAVAQLGDRPFRVIERYVDELVTVDDDQITAALLQLLERKKLLAEGAGAAPLAALLAADRSRLRGRRVCLIVSGGNVDLNVLDRIVERGLIGTGRVMRFEIVLQDVPGALAGLLGILSGQGANVLRIHHDRLGRDLPLGTTRVELWAETRDFGHIERIAEALRERGFCAAAPPAPGLTRAEAAAR